MACQVRTSYICNEILWGHRFEPAISRYPKFGGYQVDYNKIDKTYEVSLVHFLFDTADETAFQK